MRALAISILAHVLALLVALRSSGTDVREPRSEARPLATAAPRDVTIVDILDDGPAGGGGAHGADALANETTDHAVARAQPPTRRAVDPDAWERVTISMDNGADMTRVADANANSGTGRSTFGTRDCATGAGADATNRTGANATNRTGADATDRTGADATNRTGANATSRTGANAANRTDANATNRTGADATSGTGANPTTGDCVTSGGGAGFGHGAGRGRGFGVGFGDLAVRVPDNVPAPPAPPPLRISKARPAKLVYPARDRDVVDEADLFVARVTVDHDGDVVGARMVKTRPGPRGDQAASAIWTFRYLPALDDDGVAIRSTFEQPFQIRR